LLKIQGFLSNSYPVQKIVLYFAKRPRRNLPESRQHCNSADGSDFTDDRKPTKAGTYRKTAGVIAVKRVAEA